MSARISEDGESARGWYMMPRTIRSGDAARKLKEMLLPQAMAKVPAVSSMKWGGGEAYAQLYAQQAGGVGVGVRRGKGWGKSGEAVKSVR